MFRFYCYISTCQIFAESETFVNFEAVANPPERLSGLDAADPFAPRRSSFLLDGTVYLNGNSLGPLPVAAHERICRVLDVEWGRDRIRSWNTHDWINLPQRVGNRIAALVGAAPDQIVAGDSTSVCLVKLAAAAMRSQPRRRVVTDTANFPTDLYVLDGLARLDPTIELVRVAPDAVGEAVDDDTALLVLTHVDYRTSAMYDLRAITEAAHRRGALMLWDLSHSAGAMALTLDADEVDLAVGCTYKYLNGGPGAPAFAYVARRLQDVVRPALTGWMGHRAPFTLDAEFTPADGVRRYACGTPEVLALSVLDAALDAFAGVDMRQVRDKAVRMSEVFIELIDERCSEFGVSVASPRDSARRGAHVALMHESAYAVMQALIARNIIGDFRAPNLMRFGFAPLYQSYADVWHAADALRSILATRAWDCDEYKRMAFVT